MTIKTAIIARKKSIFLFLLITATLACLCNTVIKAQEHIAVKKDSSTLSAAKDTSLNKKQRDLIDYALMILHKNPDARQDSAVRNTKRLHISAAPIIEYTLTSGFAGGMSGNAGFVTDDGGHTNVSSFLATIKYTQRKQFLMPLESSVWTKNNKYDFVGDWRYLKYPQETYGFGGFSTTANGYIVDYDYMRFYQYALRKVTNNFYMGLGYQLDYHWNITEISPPAGGQTDFEKYGFSNSSVSSGIGLDLLYDSRKNSINPEGGSFYSNIVLLQNSTILGSTSNWNSVLIDIRKYIKLPHNNVLALWSYNVFTLSGNPPYLDLPGTSTDTYNNTGRGYPQDRFIGKKMMDFESEMRFGITRNGLLGGVIFANAETLSELNNNRFETILPAAGIGLRFKFNKFSNTNACIDYAVGLDGSHGFFGNLGEVF